MSFVLTSGRIVTELGWGQRYMKHVDIQRAFPFVRDRKPLKNPSTAGDTRKDKQGGQGHDASNTDHGSSRGDKR